MKLFDASDLETGWSGMRRDGSDAATRAPI